MATFRVRKVWNGLTERQVRDHFPHLVNSEGGIPTNIKLDNMKEDLGDGDYVHVGYILERIPASRERQNEEDQAEAKPSSSFRPRRPT